MTEKVLSEAQVAEMGSLRRVHDLTKCATAKFAKLWMSHQRAMVQSREQNAPKRLKGLARQTVLAKLTGKQVRRPSKTRWCDYISNLWPRLGVEPAKLWDVGENREVFQKLLGLLTPQPSREDTRVW